MNISFSFEVYSPREMSLKLELVAVTKVRLATLPTLMLGMAAGGFIGLGSLMTLP